MLKLKGNEITLAWNERHGEILKIISLKKKVGVGELTRRLNVSEVTVRKDLSLLEDMGHILRTRGGAILAADRRVLKPAGIRKKENLPQKRAIAEKAAELVEEGDTIYIDSGSTCLLFAKGIKEKNLRVVTNSLDVLNELGDTDSIALFSVGGAYRRDAGSFIGPISVEGIRSFHVQTAFLGATGITRDGRFSSQNVIESQLKRKVIGAAARSVVLTDSSKFESSAFSVFAQEGDIDAVITDSGIGGKDWFSSDSVEVIICSP
ncbi:MAG: DeoR/GlpR family DNA-binding transcription regulator [Spirochaetia bacterium]